MTWSDHVGSINSKANKRLFFLRKLNQAGADKSIMQMFKVFYVYHSSTMP